MRAAELEILPGSACWNVRNSTGAIQWVLHGRDPDYELTYLRPGEILEVPEFADINACPDNIPFWCFNDARFSAAYLAAALENEPVNRYCWRIQVM